MEWSPFVSITTQFLAISLLAYLTDMQEQIMPLAAFCECFWEATCLEGKMDTKVLEDWQNNLGAPLVRGEDGCDKPEDCRFSFQWDTSPEKQIWSLIKINPVYPLLSVLNAVPILKLVPSKSVALVCTTARRWPCAWGQPWDEQWGCAGEVAAG